MFKGAKQFEKHGNVYVQESNFQTVMVNSLIFIYDQSPPKEQTSKGAK